MRSFPDRSNWQIRHLADATSAFLCGGFKTASFALFFIQFISFIGVMILPLFSYGQTAWPAEESAISETRSSGQLISHKLYLGANFPATYGSKPINTVRNHQKFYTKPTKGTITSQGKDGSGHYVLYKPFLHAEGADSFKWTAKDVDGLDLNFTFNLRITPAEDALQAYVSNVKQGSLMELSLVEEQNLVASIEIFDPDPEKSYSTTVPEDWPDVVLTGDNQSDLNNFELISDPSLEAIQQNTDATRNGWSWTYKLLWKGEPVNFESLQQTLYNLRIVTSDTLNNDAVKSFDLTVEVVDVSEPPHVVFLDPKSYGTQILAPFEVDDYPGVEHTGYSYTLLEDKDLIITIPIELESPDKKKIKLKYTTDRFFSVENNSSTPPIEEVKFSFFGSDDFLVLEDNIYTNELNASLEGNLTISFPIENSFLPTSTFRFYAMDSSGAISAAGGKDIPALTIRAEIINDYSDDFIFGVSSPSDLESTGSETEPHPRIYKENDLIPAFDFYIEDPDSWPSSDLRRDNNSSTHEGALVLYSLAWTNPDDQVSYTSQPPEEIFKISPDGILEFQSPPDYEFFYPKTQFKLRVIASDSSIGNTNSHKRHERDQYVTIDLIDEPEDPMFIDISRRVAPSPTFTIRTFEDVAWKWSLASYDENDKSLWIAAKDLDKREATYELPTWRVVSQPALGFVNENMGLDESWLDGNLSVPLELEFTPYPNRTGSDSFELDFGNTEQRVKFFVTVENLPDRPVLIEAVNMRGEAGKEPALVVDGVFTYDLNFTESDGLEYQMTFGDLEDREIITRITQVPVGDYTLFDILDQELEVTDDALIKKLMVRLSDEQDAEKPGDRNGDGIYELVLNVEDNTTSSSNYTFKFHLQNVDEGPIIFVPQHSPEEEQNIAIPGLTARDPEGETKKFIWSIDKEKGDGRYFKFSTYDTSFVDVSRVDLLFENDSIPSFENDEERDLNVTISVSDGTFLSTKLINISLEDVNDAPSQYKYNVTIFEPEKIAVADLNDIFIDEDRNNNLLTFQLPSSVDNEFFALDGDALIFRQGYSDHEERKGFNVSLVATDQTGSAKDGNLTIIVADMPEPPQIRDGELDDDDYVFNDPIIFSKKYFIQEDQETIVTNLIFFDPEDPAKDPRNLTFSTIGDYEGTFKILPSETNPNGTFSYKPPLDYYSAQGEELTVDLNITDPSDRSEIFTFLFEVDEVPDPPKINFILDGNKSFFEANDLSNSTLYNNEGFVDVAILQADDSLDEFPTVNFDWELSGYDSNLFVLETRLEGKREMYLRWNLDELNNLPPDYGFPPVNPKDGNPRQSPAEYELKIILFGDLNDRSLDGENTTVKSLNVQVYDRAKEPPFFTHFEFPAYLEESDDLYVGSVEAIDPDALELELENKSGNEIHYTLLPSNIYSDFRFFDQDKFNTKLEGSISQEGGELYFISSPDFENLMESRGDTTLKIWVEANEWDGEKYVDDSSTRQVIEVKVNNKIEIPFFESVDIVSPTVDFSQVEDSNVTFTVEANTLDFDKNLTIRIPESQVHDNSLFAIKSLTGGISENAKKSLFFKELPDRESPRDQDKDNIYQVKLEILTSDPSVTAEKVFSIEVTDADSEFYIEQEEIIRVSENQTFVTDLEVVDFENQEVFPDLLFYSDEGVFYVPNSYEDSEIYPLVDSSKLEVVSEKLETRAVFSADLNNDGSQDIVSLSGRKVSLHINKGYGTFEPEVDLIVDSSSDFPSTPRQGLAHDFDQDGHMDLLISFYSAANPGDYGIYLFRNNGSGSFSLPETLPFNGLALPSRMAILDLDSDQDIDLIVADRETEEVVSFLWENDTFIAGGTLASRSEHGIREPTIILPVELNQSLPINSYQYRDFLIGGKGKIWAGSNDGMGGFNIREVVTLGDSSSLVEAIEVVDLDENKLPDLLFVAGTPSKVFFSLQIKKDFFSVPYDLTSAHGIVNPRSIEILHGDGEGTFGNILIGTSNPTNIYQFRAPAEINQVPGISFSSPQKIELPEPANEGGVYGVQITDLDRAYNFYEFSFIEKNNFEAFDENKIKSGGRLLFKNIPDFESPTGENPTGEGKGNTYKVMVEFSKTNPSTGVTKKNKKLISVEVYNENEPPSIETTSLDWIQKENHLVVWEELTVQNPESEDGEQITFSLRDIDQNDGNKFNIDPLTGMLSFISRYREEERADENKDGVFEIRIRAQDAGGLFDEADFSVTLENQHELPVAKSLDLSFEMEEDSFPLILELVDFNVTDNPLNPDPKMKTANIFQAPENGKIELDGLVFEETVFTYTPDANFSGSDQAVLEFLNREDLPIKINLEFIVLPVEDPPVSRVPSILEHPEGDLNVTMLLAYDSDPGDKTKLFWRMRNPSDENFRIIGKNNLYFRYDPDYEESRNNILSADLILSDGLFEVPYTLGVVLSNRPDEYPTSSLDGERVNIFKMIEHKREVTLLNLEDPDGLSTPGAKITGGVDSEFFEISNGALIIKQPHSLSFESPQDFNQDNVYELKLSVYKENLSREHYVFVEIIDLDENPPYFTTLSANGERLDSTVLTAPENQNFVGFLTAQDIEEADLSFDIIGGSDKDLFVINKKSGEILFKSPQNYEATSEKVGGLTVEFPFELEVQVSDGTYTTTENLSVRVTDINDLPYLEKTVFSGVEDQLLSAALNPLDEDGEKQLIRLTLTQSTSYGKLTFNAGSFSFSYQPDAHFYGTDSFQVAIVDDQEGEATAFVQIEVSEVNDPPVASDRFHYYFNEDPNATTPLYFSVFSDEIRGPDHESEVPFYEYVVVEPLDEGSLQGGSQKGDFVYTPDANSTLGFDSFTYQILDADLNNTAEVVIWRATLPSYPKWVYLRNFGLFYHQHPKDDNTWIYHEKMGWLYVHEFSNIYNASWIWHDLIGWFWTGDWNADLSKARWLYSDLAEMWLHWEGGIRDQAGWFTRDYANQVYDEDFFTRLNIRKDIINVLPDISGLVGYLESSNYFSRAEIVTIIGELNRFRKSNTLDSILEYKLPY